MDIQPTQFIQKIILYSLLIITGVASPELELRRYSFLENQSKALHYPEQVQEEKIVTQLAYIMDHAIYVVCAMYVRMFTNVVM